MKGIEIVGWYYEGKYHCIDCAQNAGMDCEKSIGKDEETSNPVPFMEVKDGCECDTCGGLITPYEE